MNRIIAVSGGVDSVVLLDIMARGTDRLVVAHVDHGIRGEESKADARFVATLARQYGLPYVHTELKLGVSTSEDMARTARYAFLFEQAKQFDADIVTAHHQDDVLGSVAINIIRGTGWRGLAVHNRPGVARPLLGWTKRQIYEYATQHRLEWVEDATNRSDAYLRNRLQASLRALPAASERTIIELRQRQLQLKHDIERELERIWVAFGDNRYPYIQVEPRIAIEILRMRYGLTHPTAERMLHALKTGRPGSVHDIDNGRKLELDRKSFVVVPHPE